MEIESIGVLPEKVNVVVRKAPILSPVFDEAKEGESLRSIFEKHSSGLSEECSRIYVNGEEVSDWNTTVENGQCVSICQIPSGTGAEVLIWYAVISFAVGAVIGYILYNSMDQPQTDGDGERLKKITGARNQAKPYEHIPVILGKRRVVPAYAAQPYTYWEGDVQYLKMLLCVGYGPLKISDIKIGESPIDDFSDIDYRILDWYIYPKQSDSIRQIWNTDVQQDSINQELDISLDVSRSAPSGTNKMYLAYTFPAGLWANSDIDPTVQGIQVTVKIAGQIYSLAEVKTKKDGTEWGTDYLFNYDDLVKDDDGSFYIIDNLDGPSSTGARGTLSGQKKNVTSYVQYVDSKGYALIKAPSSGNPFWVNTKSHREASRAEFTETFSWEPVDPATGQKYEDSFTYSVRKISLVFGEGDSKGNMVNLLTATYELDSTVDDSYFGVDENVGRYPVLIALDVRATNQLSGTIDNLSCTAETVLPALGIEEDWKDFTIYSGWKWYSKWTPAEMYKWALQGPFNGAAVGNERIDSAALSEWHSECLDKEWECNEIIEDGITIKDLLNNIAFTGRAFFSMKEGKFSVIENKVKENPTQVFTSKNSSNLKSKRQFKPETDGIKYKFANAARTEQEDEGIYADPERFNNTDPSSPKDGAKITGKYEEFEVWGTTNPTLARKHARFAWFEDILRREIYTLETDIEALVASRGDKVLVANDIIDIGLGQGFVKNIDGSNIQIDEEINLDVGFVYAMTIRSVSFGTSIETVSGVYNGDGWFSVQNLPASVEVGDLVMYGTVGKNYLECLVQEITYGEDYTATLTLVNYAPDLYSLTDGYIPEYDSGLPLDRPRDRLPAPPLIYVPEGNFSYETNSVRVRLTQANFSRYEVSRFYLEMRYAVPFLDTETGRITYEGNWRFVGYSPADDGVYDVPISTNKGTIIQFRGQVSNPAGILSPFSETKEVYLSSDPSDNISALTVTEQVDVPKTENGIWSTLLIQIEPPVDRTNYLYSVAEYRREGQDTWQTIGNIGYQTDNSIAQQVYADGTTYEVRVRAASVFGVINENGLTETITVTNTNDPDYVGEDGGEGPDENPFEAMPVPNVSGLELFGKGNDTEFDGLEALFTWRETTIKDWIEIGNEGLKGASSSVLDAYFKDYFIQIIADGDVVREEPSPTNSYTYTYEKNAQDYFEKYGQPGAFRRFTISVVVRSRQNQESEKPATLEVTNSVPVLPDDISVQAMFSSLTVDFTRPDDLDFVGLNLWVRTATFDPSATPPDFFTVGNFTVGELENDTTYYVAVQPVDAFGSDGAPYSEIYEATTLDAVQPSDLSGWAYQIEPADRTFIENNLAGDAVPSEKIANLTAAKITAGVINSTETITSEGVVRAVAPSVSDIQVEVGIGPYEKVSGTTNLIWAYNGNQEIFAVDDTGQARFTGEVNITGATGISNFSDAGTLVTQNTVDYTSDVTGVKPPSNADNTKYSIESGTTIGSGYLYLNDGSASIAIGNTLGFGYQGIQLQYNNGSPRMHIGESSFIEGHQYMEYEDGTLTVSGNIVGSTITGSTLRTSETGERVDIQGSGSIAFYDEFDQNTLYISPEIITMTSRGGVIRATNTNNTPNAPAAVLGEGFGIGLHGRGGTYGVLGHATELTAYSFYASTNNSESTNYGPFTGAHDTLTKKEDEYESGDILSVSDGFIKRGVSQTIPKVSPSTSELDKAVYGVFVGRKNIHLVEPPDAMAEMSRKELEDLSITYDISIVNALGEGQINVCSENGDFEVGDFICTSNTPGKGMRYDGQDMRYVVAKCMEPVKWSEEDSNIKMVACIYMCG